MELKTINRRVSLDSKYLRSDFKDKIFETLNKTIINECSESDGYIIEVDKITNINSSFVTSGTLENVFFVECLVKTIKPTKGMITEATISQLDDEDIFVDVLGLFKIMISSERLNEAGLYFSNNSYKNKKKTLSIGDKVKVQIIGSGYNSVKRRFNSIGTLLLS